MGNYFLDPLSENEIRTTNSVIRTSELVGSELGIAAMFLFENNKRKKNAIKNADSTASRISRTMLIDRNTGQTFDIHVNLQTKKIESCERPSTGQAPMLIAEFESLGDLIKSNPKWLEAMAERGITDTKHLQIDPWAVANMGFVKYEGRRLAGAICWSRLFPDDNGYARPVEGVLAIVDLTTREILDVYDFGAKPIPVKS